jgi:hypothetical protein
MGIYGGEHSWLHAATLRRQSATRAAMNDEGHPGGVAFIVGYRTIGISGSTR